MIYDRFENVACYFKEGEPLHKALMYAGKLDPATPDGRYEIEGEDLFSLVMTYETSPAEDRRFEAHTQYIDVQIVLEGEETIGFALDNDMAPVEEYSEENDVVFLETPKDSSVLVMKPGYFAVFYPHDIHRPNCVLREPQKNRKVVVKVKV